MTRGKCSGCSKRRNILMDGLCHECLSEELRGRIARCWAPGATEQQKDCALEYMDRITQATGLKVQVPLSMEGVPPALPRSTDTI